MPLDPLLLDVLADPDDKGPLLYFPGDDIVYNPRLRRRYPVRDDIPVMLPEEAEAVADDEHGRLLGKAEAEQVSPTFDAPAS